MNRFLLLLSCSVLLAARGAADSLKWEYEDGWTKSFVVTIDDTTSTMTLHDRNDGTTKSADIINARNILLYIGELMKRIPEEGIGRRATDGGVNTLELKSADAVTKRTIYMIVPPGAIGINEDYPATAELEWADEFRSSLDGYFVRSLLFQLEQHYFPPQENRKPGGKEPVASGKILTVSLSVTLCLALFAIAFLAMKIRSLKSG